MTSSIPRQRYPSSAPPPLTQSRETGEVLPTKDDASSIAQRRTGGRAWAHFVAGAAGGMASAVLTAPLDVLKTRLQSDFYQSQLAATRAARGIPPIHTLPFTRSAALHVSETFQILGAIPRIEGWRAFFKGLGPNLIGVVPARAINFFAYGNGKKFISTNLNNGKEASWVHMLAAVNAGIVTGTATCPIWVIKTRLQLDKSNAEKAGSQDARRYKNALDCTMKTLRHEGLPGLYRGLGASYLGVAESTLQWVMYEQFKMWFKKREQSIVESGREKNVFDKVLEAVIVPSAAGTAKTIAALITYPHEVVRTRMRQAPMADGKMKYTGIIQCVKLIYKEEGMAALYGGLVPHMMRVVPSAAIMFGVYEYTLRVLGAESQI